MTGRSIGHFEILEQIGEGGMGVVYKAHDPRLGRAVALKLLPAGMTADPERVARFRQEARAASALNHPHICTIYEVGEAGGVHFIAMEFVDGSTLAAETARGPIDLARLLPWAVQIADALQKAHEGGIVHRDIKPENILVSRDGYVKLADFGLAKLRDARVPPLEQTVTHLATEPGMLLGTVNYMSPEQALGRPADPRSDLFSLGLVLYEMATGRRAVEGPSAVDVLFRIVHQPLPQAALADVPSGLAAIIAKATEREPDDRYQSARELAVDLRRLLRQTQTDAADVIPARPRRRGALRIAAVAGTLALLLVAGWWQWGRWPAAPQSAVQGPPGAVRVAVLPFENLTGHPEDDWLAAAFADSLTFGLQPRPELILLSPEGVASAYRQLGAPEARRLDPRVVERLSRSLGLRHYVHGGYQKVGDEIRVTARLVDADAGTIVVQETATDSISNLLTLQNEIAHRLAARLTRGSVEDVKPETSTLEAYRALSEARALYATGRWTEAVVAARTAADLDPLSAAAWAVLAKSASRLTAPSVFEGGDPAAYRQMARQGAERAVALRPDLHEAHAALALVYRELGEVAPWRLAAQKAIDVNPRQAEGYALLADSYGPAPVWGCGRDRDAARAESLYRQALQLDPSVHAYHRNLSSQLAMAGRIRDALDMTAEALNAYPESRPLRRARAFALAVAGQWEEVEAVLGGSESQTVEERVLLAHADKRRRAGRSWQRQVDALVDRGVPYMRLMIAAFSVASNDAETARRYVREMLAVEPDCAGFLRLTDAPFFARLRKDPVIAGMIERDH
ncbi:MAG TPA: protein kinase [Vicinamibacterales bacterium]|nr:protein kinase [Vicinamibacterales bacterium]